MSYKSYTVAAIIPAHNEEQAIAKVVTDLAGLECPHTQQRLLDRIIVCDNASTDATAKAAQQAGANVYHEFRKGYGFACLRGIDKLNTAEQTPPDLVVFVDGDDSANPQDLSKLLDKLIDGNDLVVGARQTHLQEANAISPHQQFGNWLASGLIRFIWGEQVSDLGPFRAIRYRSLKLIDMQDQRFGWTVEMQVKVIQAGMAYAEVPVITKQRIGKSKISGTVRGTIGAAIGIFGKIFTLFALQPIFKLQLRESRTFLDSSLENSAKRSL